MSKFCKILFFISSLLLIVGCFSGTAYAEDTSSKFHITIVGSKDSEVAKNLYLHAVKHAPKNAEVEWWDGKGPVPAGSTVKYPVLAKPAAYICVENKCSLPAFTTEKLELLIAKFSAPESASIDQSARKDIQSDTSLKEASAPDSSQNKFTETLKTRSLWVVIPLFWFFGLLLSLTPCLLPLMLIITSIIGGSSGAITKTRAFSLALTYVISLAVTYAVAGIVVASFGFYLQGFMQNSWVLGGFSLVFIILGISLFGFFNVQLPQGLRRTVSSYSKTRNSGSYIGVAIMGVLATLIASPCVAAPLAGILAYIAQSGNVQLGALALFATGVGIGTPVLIVSVIGARLLHGAGKFQKYVKQFFGLILFGIAIWLLGRIIPPVVTMLSWAALVIFTAIHLGVLERKPTFKPSSNTGNKSAIKLANVFIKTISLMLLVYGGALLFGAMIGNTSPLAPLNLKLAAQSDNSITISSFKQVKNMEDLQKFVISAKESNKPVMLLFSAEWCTACKEIDHNVLPDDRVQNMLREFMLLTVDLTNMNAGVEGLVKSLDIIGPPVILFYKNGVKSQIRIDGEVSAAKLTAIMRGILNAS